VSGERAREREINRLKMKRVLITPNPKYIEHLRKQKVVFSKSRKYARWSPAEYTPETVTIEKYPKGYRKFDGVIGVNEYYEKRKSSPKKGEAKRKRRLC